MLMVLGQDGADGSISVAIRMVPWKAIAITSSPKLSIPVARSEKSRLIAAVAHRRWIRVDVH